MKGVNNISGLLLAERKRDSKHKEEQVCTKDHTHTEQRKITS